MLLLLDVRLMGDCDLYCMSSECTGIPKSNTALRDVITYVHSARHNRLVLHR